MRIPAALWPRLSRLLDEALNLDGDARGAWLARLDREDAELGTHLRRLLEAHAQPAERDPLHDPPSSLIASALAHRSPALGLAAGHMLGPYRLVEPLGEGGMASVWLAEQTINVRRRVALKIPHTGLEAPEATAARLERECDLLASLEHPHIARLYDADASADGLPYLAMEWIDGVPITRYADAHRLGIPERVALFQQVLEAVRFAHARLIIHRDIKPSNILVTPDGEVKLLDFGIARLLDDTALQGDAMTAAAGSRALTPESASPEQLAGATLTTPSDVYSLGIVLYELLCGQRPYRLDASLRESDAAAVHAAVLEARIAPPSALELDDATAACRGTSPHRLRKQLVGDLDAIVAKSLMKEPGDRYDSAEAMGADLGRWQRGWPVEARHAGAGYRIGRFVQRHRAIVATTAAIAIALSTGLAVALWQAEHARQEARISNAVQAFVVQLFDASDPEQSRGRDVSAKELLDRGAKRLDTELQDQPAVLAQLHHKIGDIYVQLGSNVQGRAHLEKALVLYRSLGQQGSERAIDAEFSLGELLDEDMQFDLARQAMARCLALADEHFGAHNRWRLRVQGELAWADVQEGHAQAAVDRLMAALAEAERDGHPLDYPLVKVRANLANAHLELGQYALARDEFVAVLKDGAAVGEEVTSVMADRYNLARARYNLGEFEVAAGELEALIPEMDRHIGAQHDRTIKARSLWAQALAENGEFVRAVEVQRVNLTAVRARSASDEDVLQLQEMVLAKLLKVTMQPREGLPLARSALAFMDAKYVDPTWLTEAARRITAELLMENGELDEAMRMLDVTAERSRRIDNHQGSTLFADLLQVRATALRLRAGSRDLETAVALLGDAQAIYAQALGPAARATLRCAAYRTWIEALASSAGAPAAQRFLQAAAAYEATLPPTHLARAELDLMRADLGRREAPAGTLHAQASAREHAGRTGWKASLGLDFAPPLLGLH